MIKQEEKRLTRTRKLQNVERIKRQNEYNRELLIEKIKDEEIKRYHIEKQEEKLKKLEQIIQ